MQHMVVYRSRDGRSGYFQADDLDGAVRYVEHLRNAENVTDCRIFSMQEVPIEFKTYYRVEVGPSEAAPVVEEAGEVGEMTGPVPVAPSAASRFGLFGR